MSIHERLIATWNACEFGVKQRVFNDEYPQTTIQYILKTPTYKDTDKMKDIIQIIKFHANEVKGEIQDMYNEIESID